MRSKKAQRVEFSQPVAAGDDTPVVWADGRGVLLGLSILLGVLLLATFGVQSSLGAASVYIAESQLFSQRTLAAPRGLFYDRDHTRLSVNRALWELLIPQSVVETESQLQQIASTLDLSLADLQVRMTVLTDGSALVDDLSNDQMVKTLDLSKELGLEILQTEQRYYMFPESFAHIIGYTGQPSVEEVQAGADVFDQVGKYRLEKILNSQLTGTKGKQVDGALTFDQAGGVPGNNVVLTIDVDWQQKFYELLAREVSEIGAPNASGVIIDTATGDIWAMAGYPSFDANLFAQGITADQYQQLLNDINRPLVDKAIGQQAAPGSSFKLVSAYATLQSQAIDGSTHYFSNVCRDLGGYQFCEFGKFFLGDLDVIRALTRSSNIFFCNASLQLATNAGSSKYSEYASALGIGQPTGIGLEGELAGVLPNPDYKQKTFHENWFDGDTCNTAIGQGMVLVTPLQMANMVATIYNGGSYFRPNLIARIEDQQGTALQTTEPEIIRQVPISEGTRQLILTGIDSVVNSWEGTAKLLDGVPGNFRAKTGSAEAQEFIGGAWREGVHGWAVGLFDYQDKTFSFAVQTHFGGAGWTAVQVMQRFGQCLYSDFSAGCGN